MSGDVESVGNIQLQIVYYKLQIQIRRNGHWFFKNSTGKKKKKSDCTDSSQKKSLSEIKIFCI